MNIAKKMFFIFTLISIISCDNGYNRNQYEESRCNCGIKLESPIVNFDSTSAYYEKEIGYDVDAQLSSVFAKKVADLTVGSKFNITRLENERSTIVKEVADIYPEVTNFSTIKKEYYCAIVNAICLDTTISDTKLSEIKVKELRKIDSLLESIFLFKMGMNTIINDEGIVDNNKIELNSDFSLRSDFLDAGESKRIKDILLTNDKDILGNYFVSLEISFNNYQDEELVKISLFEIKIYKNDNLCGVLKNPISTKFKSVLGVEEKLKQIAIASFVELVETNPNSLLLEFKKC